MAKNVPVELKMSFHQHYQAMWPFVKPYAFRALLAILISIPIGALDSVVALALKPYMDIVLVDKSAQSPTYIPFLIIAFTSVQGGLNYAATYLNTWVGTKINHDVKRALFKKLLSLETSFFDDNDSGVVIQRFSTDTDTACTGLLENLKTFFSRFFSSVSLVCVLIYNSWQLSIIAIIFLFGALLPLTSVKRRIKNSIARSVEETTKIYTNYNETHNGNKTISSYNLQSYIYSKFDATLKVIFKLTMKIVQKTGWMTPLMHIIVSAGIGGVIWYGSTLIVEGKISAGNFVSFITALVLLYTPIKSIGKSFNNVQISFLAIERIIDILNIQPKIENAHNSKTLRHVKQGIEFQNVAFEYVPGVPVLKNINLKVKAGSNIAIVGNSGGGKTTLVNLLPRFYDTTGGKILIDGVDIKKYSLESLRNNISVVFQDNFLFSGTIRENILLGNQNATQEEIDKGNYTNNSSNTSSPITIKLTAIWMSQNNITQMGSPFEASVEAVANKAWADMGYRLDIENVVAGVDSDACYDRLKAGEFDLGMGAITGYALDPLGLTQIFCSDNRSGFTLNWGPDTSVTDDRLTWAGEKYSFDGFCTASYGGGIYKDGNAIEPAILEVSSSRAFNLSIMSFCFLAFWLSISNESNISFIRFNKVSELEETTLISFTTDSISLEPSSVAITVEFVVH